MTGRALTALLMVLVSATPITAQDRGVVVGRVVDATTGAPVAAAAVRVLGTVLVAFADDSGRFELRSVPPGRQSLSAERFGYAPRQMEVQVRSAGRTEIEIALEPRAVAVGEIVTTVTKREISSLEAPV
ncbi:MAG: carboxypeptidase-like regulatory domain-containing protein, partial [Gemmatimonadales bacterium]